MWVDDDGYDRERSDIDYGSPSVRAAGSQHEERDTAEWLDWVSPE